MILVLRMILDSPRSLQILPIDSLWISLDFSILSVLEFFHCTPSPSHCIHFSALDLKLSMHY